MNKYFIFPNNKISLRWVNLLPVRLLKYIQMVFFAVLICGFQPAQAAENNPYPTVAIADYVFACMTTNGQTRDALERCSCSIDVIASILTYENYIKAETVMQLRLVGGEKSAIFKTSARFKGAVADLKRAQAEAEIRCF